MCTDCKEIAKHLEDMDWDMCTNSNCYTTYYKSREIEACSKPDCGLKRPRCPVCNINFVSKMWELCTGCATDPAVSCDNCSNPSTVLFRTDLGELWCFDCLPKYHEKGPALSFNRDILKNDRDARVMFYDQKLPTLKRHCKSCGGEFNASINSNICSSCLPLLSKRICTKCFNEISVTYGSDKLGRCMTCSDNVLEGDLDYAYGAAAYGDVLYTDVDGYCTNCDNNRVMVGKQICVSCNNIARRMIDALDI